MGPLDQKYTIYSKLSIRRLTIFGIWYYQTLERDRAARVKMPTAACGRAIRLCRETLRGRKVLKEFLLPLSFQITLIGTGVSGSLPNRAVLYKSVRSTVVVSTQFRISADMFHQLLLPLPEPHLLLSIRRVQAPALPVFGLNTECFKTSLSRCN